MNTIPSTKPINFKDSLEELRKIVEQLEQPGVSLEESLANYQQGVKLAEHCHKQLTEAKGLILRIQNHQGEVVSKPFSDD